MPTWKLEGPWRGRTSASGQGPGRPGCGEWGEAVAWVGSWRRDRKVVFGLGAGPKCCPAGWGRCRIAGRMHWGRGQKVLLVLEAAPHRWPGSHGWTRRLNAEVWADLSWR